MTLDLRYVEKAHQHIEPLLSLPLPNDWEAPLRIIQIINKIAVLGGITLSRRELQKSICESIMIKHHFTHVKVVMTKDNLIKNLKYNRFNNGE